MGDELPDKGLISFFGHSEWDSYGVHSVGMRYRPEPVNLSRRLAPALPQHAANSDEPYHELIATDVLRLPTVDTESPWYEDLKDGVHPGAFEDAYWAATDTFEPDVLGLGGYLRGTSGGDPTPDKDHMRFAVLRIRPEAGIVHLAISKQDLAALNFEGLKYVWMDIDS